MCKDIEKIWILTCDTSRYDVHTLFKENGFCLWNQRRDFKVGDVVYIYETKPVSQIIYKTVVEEVNIRRTWAENEDNFYTRDYNKDFAFKIRCVAKNPGNRLQFAELHERFGFSGMKLLAIPRITDKEFINFAEDVFACNVEDIPNPPTKEELFQLLNSASIIEQIIHKMDFCEIKTSHLVKQSGVSYSSVNKVRGGNPVKSENMLLILDGLGFAFCNENNGTVISATSIKPVIQDLIISSGIRPTKLAAECNASSSVISLLKNNGILPKFEILESLLEKYNLKLVLKQQ